jgi:hypothetical protein
MKVFRDSWLSNVITIVAWGVLVLVVVYFGGGHL